MWPTHIWPDNLWPLDLWSVWGEGSAVNYTAFVVDCGIPVLEVEAAVPVITGWSGVPPALEVTIGG